MDISSAAILIEFWTAVFGLVALGLVALAVSLYLGIQWWKHKDREKESLEFVTLLVSVPRDNEVKIDAMEQVFSALASIRNKGWWIFDRLVRQEHLSFEIVAQKEDIRFYVSCPRNLLDLVEKQINGAWPGGDIVEVSEPNIFSKGGKVAFAALKTTGAKYEPIKAYRELSTDPLSSITSVLAKMEEGEAAMIQIIVEPASDDWQTEGGSYISATKKREADPKEAKFSADAKTFEAIGNKTSKAGFETSIRIVVVARKWPRPKNILIISSGHFPNSDRSIQVLTHPGFWPENYL